MTIHTIFVPAGWSVEQVWETIKRGEKPKYVVDKGVWVNVDERGKLLA